MSDDLNFRGEPENAYGIKSQKSMPTELRRKRFEEQKKMIDAQDAAEQLEASQKEHYALLKKEKILSLSQGRNKSKTSRVDEKSFADTQINLQNNRPVTSGEASLTGISQEQRRFELRQKREKELEITRLEEEK